jgi:hypothetical protein
MEMTKLASIFDLLNLGTKDKREVDKPKSSKVAELINTGIRFQIAY